MKSIEFNECIKALELLSAERKTGAVIASATATLASELPKWGAAKIYQFRAQALGENGDCAAAIMDYSAALREMPDSPELHTGRGDIYRRMENYRQAIRDYDEVIALRPRAEAAYTARAIAHELAGDFAAAESDFAEAARLAAAPEVPRAASKKSA